MFALIVRTIELDQYPKRCGLMLKQQCLYEKLKCECLQRKNSNSHLYNIIKRAALPQLPVSDETTAGYQYANTL